MNRIVTNPKILNGKPIIKNTRISVEFVLEYAARSIKNEVYISLDKVA